MALKKVHSISKTKSLFACGCGNEIEAKNIDVERGRLIMCKDCATKLTAPSLRQKYASEYTTYCHMLSRITNPDDKDYFNYGGRGIRICDEWLNSFDAFFLAMGPKPFPGYTIERKDHNGNYCPTNCCWLSRAEQNANKRDNVQATINGKTQIVSQWIVELNLQSNADSIYKRMERGMSPEEAITKSHRKYDKK